MKALDGAFFFDFTKPLHFTMLDLCARIQLRSATLSNIKQPLPFL
ncbi:hypothetical protein VCRA2133E348_200001 [Vibrio crassostreae]|nr:hypothetical protein VCRA2133E348_200001 [Vibrio crassostreae]CAK3207731.1 hypothetical protein VCRA213O314_180001 [Vibrio crassostreae]